MWSRYDSGRFGQQGKSAEGTNSFQERLSLSESSRRSIRFQGHDLVLFTLILDHHDILFR